MHTTSSPSARTALASRLNAVTWLIVTVENASKNASPVTTCDRYRSECHTIPTPTPNSSTKSTACELSTCVAGKKYIAYVVKKVSAHPPPIPARANTRYCGFFSSQSPPPSSAAQIPYAVSSLPTGPKCVTSQYNPPATPITSSNT